LEKLGLTNLTEDAIDELFEFVNKDGSGEINVKQLDKAMKGAVTASRGRVKNHSKLISPRKIPGPQETVWGRLGPPPPPQIQTMLSRSPSPVGVKKSRYAHVKGGKPGERQMMREMDELRQVLKQRFKTRKKAFLALDTNKSGGVSYSELAHGFDRLGIPWAQIFESLSFREVFKMLDTDRKGDLDKDELLGQNMDIWDEEDLDADDEVMECKRHPHPTKYMSKVKEFDDQISTLQFVDWANQQNRWQVIAELFRDDETALSFPSRKVVHKPVFLKFCELQGYQGDLHVIFGEIRLLQTRPRRASHHHVARSQNVCGQGKPVQTSP
jgi:Ca2+-binding EF-hand superfamily protein